MGGTKSTPRECAKLGCRYRDTGHRFPHLANAWKYAFAQTVSLYGVFHPNYTGSKGALTRYKVWPCYRRRSIVHTGLLRMLAGRLGCHLLHLNVVSLRRGGSGRGYCGVFSGLPALVLCAATHIRGTSQWIGACCDVVATATLSTPDCGRG